MRSFSVTTELALIMCHSSEQGDSKQVVEEHDAKAERTAET